jgi:hypothetical protein
VGAIYNGGGIVQSEAPHITVTTSGAVWNQQLENGGQLNGHVTLNGDTPDVDPGFGTYVEAFAADSDDSQPVAYDYVNSTTGTYSMAGAPSRYVLKVTTIGETAYQSEWFDNAPSRTDATGIDPIAFSATVVDFDLGTGSTAAGTVTRAGGAPLEGYDIAVEGDYYSGVYSTTTGATVKYQWLLNNNPIPGATSSTPAIAPSFYGHTLRFEMSASKSGYIAAYIESDSVTVTKARAPTVVSSKKPTISGGASTCQTYSVSTGAWSVSGATFTFEWFYGPSGDTSTSIATTATYDGQFADIANALWVRVRATAYGYADGVFDTPVTSPVTLGGFCS